MILTHSCSPTALVDAAEASITDRAQSNPSVHLIAFFQAWTNFRYSVQTPVRFPPPEPSVRLRLDVPNHSVGTGARSPNKRSRFVIRDTVERILGVSTGLLGSLGIQIVLYVISTRIVRVPASVLIAPLTKVDFSGRVKALGEDLGDTLNGS